MANYVLLHITLAYSIVICPGSHLERVATIDSVLWIIRQFWWCLHLRCQQWSQDCLRCTMHTIDVQMADQLDLPGSIWFYSSGGSPFHLSHDILLVTKALAKMHEDNHPLKIKCGYLARQIPPSAQLGSWLMMWAMFAQSQWSVTTVCPRP